MGVYGNKFAVGNEGGKPPFFKTPQCLEKKVVDYFESIEGEYDKKKKEWIVKPQPPTITGIALHCGFASRQSFYDYEKKQEFAYIIKRSRTIVENCHELGLHGNSNTGHIFALKTMGWNDSPNEKELSNDIDFTKLSPEEINIYLALIKKSRVD